MNPQTFIHEKQMFWAHRHNKKLIDDKRYVQNGEDNLFEPLGEVAVSQFNAADGGELKPTKDGPPKMHALHSSSALGVNVFHYWSRPGIDKTPLAKAMEIPSGGIESIGFESLRPISEPVNRDRFPKDPNIDVLIKNDGGSVREVGIESKFSEAYGLHDGLKSAYLEHNELWTNLPNCRIFAESVQGPQKVDGLNCPQLLKHVLGLKQKSGIGKFWLVYMWYATPGPELGAHFQQLESFREILAKDGIRFHFQTYQELICRLAKTVGSEHRAYIDYLMERYV